MIAARFQVNLNVWVEGGALGVKKAELSEQTDSETPRRLPVGPKYYIGLNVHRRENAIQSLAAL
jgi:hypothetical protein